MIARFTNTEVVSERYRTGLGKGTLVEFELMKVWLRKSIKYRLQRSRLRPSSKDEAEAPTTSLYSVLCAQTQTCLDLFNEVQTISQRFPNRISLLIYLFVLGFISEVTLCEGTFPQWILNKIPNTQYIISLSHKHHMMYSACYTSGPSCPFYYLNNIQLAINTEHIFNVKFSSDSCGFLPLGAKYFPLQTFLMQTQFPLFPPHDRGSATPTKIGKKGKVHPCTGTEALYRPYGP
jgi:hypothetical protein